LLVDDQGNLIPGGRTGIAGFYPLTDAEIRRCTHIIVQERHYEWAEFRDIPVHAGIRGTVNLAAQTKEVL